MWEVCYKPTTNSITFRKGSNLGLLKILIIWNLLLRSKLLIYVIKKYKLIFTTTNIQSYVIIFYNFMYSITETLSVPICPSPTQIVLMSTPITVSLSLSLFFFLIYYWYWLFFSLYQVVLDETHEPWHYHRYGTHNSSNWLHFILFHAHIITYIHGYVCTCSIKFNT